ncbi:MAG: NrtA/SsuA/CpmA family ABC transporter substrate-binding protein [Candidatus Methanoperedens sp.]|nr:NrtA/SsuA/CpmA family ABC transporter substrate-binding protein [Candidatus Methanoperedens sp.]
MKKIVAVIAVTVAVVLLGFSLWYFANPPDTYTGKMESINIGTVPTAASALIYIAQDQHFFAANGLDVNIKDYNTGAATTEALLKGETDIAWVAEFPFVRRAFTKEEISIITVVGRFSEQYLFGRKDRGINTIADLKGKKIGIPRNTIAEFYLGRFLELHGMTAQDVTVVDIPAQESVDAIVSGRVDGVIVWEPYSSKIRVQLADKVVALPVQNNQPGYGVVAGRNNWIADHPEVVNRFLKSLAQAEDYLIRNPAQAKTIVRKQLNYDDIFTEIIWSENQFSLSLDQSLILAMEDEARWMIKNNLTTEKAVPNFLDYIYVDGLKAIKPGSVNIIR